MKYGRFLTAFGAAVILLASAEASHAGVGPAVVSVNGAPSSSLVNQNVTLTATFAGSGTCQVDFVDATNGDAPLCTASSVNATTASCTASFGSAGARTVRGSIANQNCTTSSVTYS